tara:strand:- start:153 stop:431 length:279 start_codon:yes stop_codon:yes gene_type:complete
MSFLNKKEWNAEDSSLWKEIVSRFGQSAYDNEDTRATHMATLKTEWDAKVYARSRKAKYDLLNQDEMRYDDLINSTTTWQDAIAAIKQEYPK